MSADPQPAILGFERKIAIAVLIVLAVGCGLVLLPFASAALWALVLCISCWPLYGRLLGWMGNRRSLVAGLLSLAMILVVLLPFIVVGASVGDNIKDLTATVRQWATAGPPAPPAWIGKIPVVGQKLNDEWQNLVANSTEFRAKVGQGIEWMTPKFLRGAVALGGGLLQFAMSIFIAFFLFRDGEWLRERAYLAVGRIAGERGKQLLEMAAGTIRGVVYGVLGTVVAQGIATGIGLLIAGVPNAALLTLLACFSAIVPMVGPSLIWLPAALWLFAKGMTTWGIFLLIWGVAVNNIDNFLKPYLISKGSDMPFILIFFGVLGGAVAFGFIGVFLGPTLLAVGYRLVVEWNSGKTA